MLEILDLGSRWIALSMQAASVNNGTDQLHGYHAADLRLYISMCKNGFPVL